MVSTCRKLPRWGIPSLTLALTVTWGACRARADLEDTAQWQIAGTGGTVALADVEGAEGGTALRCTVDEGRKGYLYFRLVPPSPDLTPFEAIRFRMHGGLEHSTLHELVLHDNERRYAKWRATELTERSRQAVWTECVVFFDSPVLDWETDRTSVRTITWRVHMPGNGDGDRSFLLDGVRLIPRRKAAVPGPEEVTLEHGGHTAVFLKTGRFELDHIRTSSGGIISARTSVHMAPYAPVSNTGDTVTVGGKLRWKDVVLEDGRLTVSYEHGDYLHHHSFAWEGDALAVRRQITCLTKGTGARMSKLQVVSLGDGYSTLSYDRGDVADKLELPAPKHLFPPGNWATFTGDNVPPVSVVFPRRGCHRAEFRGRRLQVTDILTFGRNALEPGMGTISEIWLHVGGGEGKSAPIGEHATRSVCAFLKKHADPAAAYFHAQYQPLPDQRRLLFGNQHLTMWQTPTWATVAESAPPPALTVDQVRLNLARGETEPLHLVLSANTSSPGTSVRVSTLAGPAETLPPDAVRVRYGAYVRVRPTTTAERDAAPEPDWARFVGEVDGAEGRLAATQFFAGDAGALGAVEDPLFDRAHVDLVPGRNQSVWITLSTPPTTTPGTYHGAIILFQKDRELCRIPLSLTVWAFTLPKVTSLRTWYQLWPNYDPVRPHWRAYYRNLAEHKVSGFGGHPSRTIEADEAVPTGPFVTLENGRISVDWKRYDEVMQYLFDDLGMRHAKLPHGKRGGGHVKVYDFVGLKEGTPEFEKAFYDYLCQAREHLSKRGWLAGLDCYIFDEPDLERTEVIRRTGPIVRRALPNLRVFPACTRNTLPLRAALNAWCPSLKHFGIPGSEFGQKQVATLKQRGDMILWYNMTDNGTGFPIIAHRALPLATWAAGLDGYFVWSINYWGSTKTPFTSRYALGDAMFIYPGVEGPVDSIRWEMTREGLEDYDYLILLAQGASDDSTPPEEKQRAHALLRQARALFPDPRVLIATNGHALSELRNEIGILLDRWGAQR